MNYCRNWKIWEGIREILQNQLDGIIMKIGKKNIKVISFGPSHNNIKFQYNFIHKETNEIFGQIEYNEVKKNIKNMESRFIRNRIFIIRRNKRYYK